MKNLQVSGRFELTAISRFLPAVNNVGQLLLPNAKTQMLIGAAPSDSAAPVAISFLPPEAEQNA